MPLWLIIVLLILVFGGGGGYYGYNRFGGYYNGLGSGLGLIIVVLVILYFMGFFRPGPPIL